MLKRVHRVLLNIFILVFYKPLLKSSPLVEGDILRLLPVEYL